MRVENTKLEMAKQLYSENTTMNDIVKLQMIDFNVNISQKQTEKQKKVKQKTIYIQQNI